MPALPFGPAIAPTFAIAEDPPLDVPGDRVMPVGTAPAVTAKVTGGEPLRVVRVLEYAWPTTASGDSGEAVLIWKPPPPPPPPPATGEKVATRAPHAAEEPREPVTVTPEVDDVDSVPTAM
jgi:hypothetical protein